MLTVQELQMNAMGEVLAGSRTDKERHVESLFVPHPTLTRIIELTRIMELTQSLMTTEPGVSVGLVVGPANVGKSKTRGPARPSNLINQP
jgi:hypothetical protein